MTLKLMNFLATVLFLFSSTVFAAEHSAVEVKTKSLSSGQVEITVVVKPASGVVINDDSNVPWQLDLKDANGISFKATKLDRTGFDAKIPGFVVISDSKPSIASWSVKYRAVVFVCTKTKDQCYREVHEGLIKS